MVSDAPPVSDRVFVGNGRGHGAPRPSQGFRPAQRRASCVSQRALRQKSSDDMVAMGFDLLQGYFGAKPLSESELVQFVRRKVRKLSSIESLHQLPCHGDPNDRGSLTT